MGHGKSATQVRKRRQNPTGKTSTPGDHLYMREMDIHSEFEVNTPLDCFCEMKPHNDECGQYAVENVRWKNSVILEWGVITAVADYHCNSLREVVITLHISTINV